MSETSKNSTNSNRIGETPDWENELLSEFEDLNLKPEDMVRGATLEGLEQKCLQLCQIYMAHDPRWAKHAKTVDDLLVSRIPGGLTNQLYLVRLKNVPDVRDKDTITIKFYQTKYLTKSSGVGDNSLVDRLNDTIISIMVDLENIGPKVYGIMPDGIIQSYHEHEQFRIKHQQNETLLRKVAHRLAQINRLQVPIEKNRFWIPEILFGYIHQSYHRIRLDQLAKELDLPYLLDNDLLAEMQWFDRFLRQYNQCPMVFCHNDFRGSNLMVVKQSDGQEDIIVCDFEYSSYGLRGQDLATFLSEWGRELFDFRDFSLPPDTLFERFVKYYLEGWDLLEPGYSSKLENSLEKIVEETKVGFLMLHVFMLGVVANQKETVFEHMPYDVKMQARQIHLIFKRFLDIKNMLIEQNIIKN